MASFTKTLRAYAAPVLLIYTVLVTWVLISTAWSEQEDQGGVPDGVHRVRKELAIGGGKSFLDVIVQEERRHIKSFKNAVRSYRDAAREDDTDKDPNGSAAEQDIPHADTHKKSRSPRRRNALAKETNSIVVSGKRRVNSNEMVADEEEGREGFSPPHNSESYNENKPGSMVEVEEWDQSSAKKQKKNVKTLHNKELPQLNSHPKAENGRVPALVKVEIDSDLKQKNALAFHNSTLRTENSNYFLKFCDRIFDDPRVVPNICDRPLIELTSKKHIPVSSETLSFRRLGDIKVYSSFLDVRAEPSVRAMVLAPSVQNDGPSIYWCVFHVHDKSPPTTERISHDQLIEKPHDEKGKSSTERGSSNTSEESKGRIPEQATVLSFYGASDGHGRPSRFFIASCPVPQSAFPLFSNPDTKVAGIEMVVGSLETAFLGAVQESVFVDVIVNKHIDTSAVSASSTSSRNLRKTLLVDVKGPSAEGHTVIKRTGLESKNAGENDPKVQNSGNFSAPGHHHKSELVIVFELDDDDEDKEISREKKHRSAPREDRASSNAGINIPQPRDVQVGEIIVSCVAPLHGRINALQIIEFVELSLLLGVQHVVFYFPSSPEMADAWKVVKMYETRGLVTALAWDLPGSGDRNQNRADDVWARGRDVALNDCLYRTMHKFDWALFLDLDEFFVPRVTPDLPSFLRYLKAEHRFNASRFTDLVFPSAFFPPPSRAHYKNLTTASGFLRDVNKFASLKSVHRTYFDQKQTLRMLRPSAVTRVGAGERKKSSFTLSHRFASVHHYSFCPRHPEPAVKGGASKSQTVVSCNHLKADWTMWRFKTLLIERARSATRLLNKG